MLREAGIITEGNLYDIFNVSVRAPRAADRCAPTRCSRATSTTSCAQDKVVIIDEFTGRMMEGRRYSDGLHQALEAKEHVTVQAGEPDARLDHLPELLPAVSEARRHDRHGDDRGRRVRRNLQAGRGRDPDQRAGRRATTRTTRSIARRARNTRRWPTLIEEARARGPAGAGRHHQHREERAAQRIC